MGINVYQVVQTDRGGNDAAVDTCLALLTRRSVCEDYKAPSPKTLDKIDFFRILRCSDLIIGIGKHKVKKSARMFVMAEASYILWMFVVEPMPVQLYDIGHA